MKRLLVSLVLCALVAGGAAPAVSTAQKGDRQPRELWDKFPLEPSATPSQAAPQPTASKPRVVRDEDSGGISAGALIALLLGAAGIGVAAHTAVRRMSARPGAAEVSTIAPPAALQRARPAEPKATEPHSPELGWRFAPPRPPSSEHEHATNGSASAAAPAELKAGRPAKEKRAAASPEAAANGAEPATKPAEAKQRRRAANRKPPAAKPKPAARRKPAATPKPAAKPKPANGADPTTKPAEPTTAPAEAPAAKRSRRSATGKPPAASPAASGSQPTEAPAANAGRPAPERQRPAAAPPPIGVPTQAAAAPPAWDSCRIKLHNRSIKAHFFAVPYEGGPVLARSPYFKIRHTEGDAGLSPPEALRALVDELTAAGWRQSGAGRAPWDLRFRRSAAPDPFASRRSR